MSECVYRFDPYEFQVSNGDLRKHGLRIKLQPKPRQILRALLERPGETVKRQELQARLWPQDTFVDFDQGLNVAMKKLRDALNESTDAPQYIETVPGVGYRFMVSPEVVHDTSAWSAPAGTERSSAESASRRDVYHQAQRLRTPTNSSQLSNCVGPAFELPSSRAKARTRVLAIAVAVILAIVMVSSFAILRPRARTQKLRVNLTLPGHLRLLSVGDSAGLALSPDGTRVVFPALRSDGKAQLWMRKMEELDPEPLPGTEDGSFPFWSPDGRSIGFFTQTKLKRLSLSDGIVREICAVDSARGGAWTKDGFIVFAPSTRTALYKVSAEGGVPTPVTKLDEKRHTTHRWPALLPDGSHFVFLAASHDSPEAPAEIYLGALDGSSPERIVEADSNAVVASGQLLFVSGGKLISRHWDAEHHRADATSTIVAEGVGYDRGSWYGNFAVDSQSVVYRPEGSPGGQVIARFNRAGKRMEDITKPGIYHTISLSPNGQTLAASCGDPNMGICLIQRDGAITRLPSTIGMEVEWSPDSGSIAYNVHSQSKTEIRIREVGKNSSERTFLSTDVGTAGFFSWDPDGKHLLVITNDSKVEVLNLITGERRSYLPAIPGLHHARISPNGKWVAYDSDESGSWEVYLVSYPVASVNYQVSTSGGVGPRWRGDSHELYYVGPGENLYAVSLEPDGKKLRIGQPLALFQPPILPPPRDRDCCDVNRDGTEFFIVAETRPEPSELVVVSHWAQ